MPTQRKGWRGERPLARLIETMTGFAGLVLNLRHVDRAGDSSFVAKTDGVNVFYGERFFNLPEAQQMGVMGHEALHVALQHPVRALRLARSRGRYYPHLGNVVMDAIINEALSGSMRLALPEGKVTYADLCKAITARRAQIGEVPDRDPLAQPVSRWSFEALYLYAERYVDEEMSKVTFSFLEADVELEEDPDPDQNGIGSGRFAQTGAGETLEGRIQARMQAASRALQSARHAGKGMGKIVSALEGDMPQSRTPWQKLLRTFVARQLSSELAASWQRPSRRGVLEPGRARLKPCPRIVCCLDTSGSIGQTTLGVFAKEMKAIATRAGASMHVIVADDGIHERFDVPAGDPRNLLGRIRVTGAGGTSFTDAVVEADKMKPDAIVYFTDLIGAMPPEPRSKLFWAVPESVNANPQASVGQVLALADL